MGDIANKMAVEFLDKLAQSVKEQKKKAAQKADKESKSEDKKTK